MERKLIHPKFGKRTNNTLINNNITSMEQLQTLTFDQIRNLKGLGTKGLEQIIEALGMEAPVVVTHAEIADKFHTTVDKLVIKRK